MAAVRPMVQRPRRSLINPRKDCPMGVSTPKPAFNLAAFLSEKAPAKSRRKPTWSRQAPRAEAEVDVEVAADDAADPTTTPDAKE